MSASFISYFAAITPDGGSVSDDSQRLNASARPNTGAVLALVLFWAAAFAFTLSTLLFFNDHFGRISPARQILRYGELPFRDFFDPGYYLTEFSSAAMQWLLGDNLLGEALLDASFIATGTAIVLLLAARLSRSVVAGTTAAVIALLSMPRAYDYDKVLFYPLGVLLCWRYVDRRRPVDLVLLAAAIVVAALFRYDTGVYIGAAAIIGIAMTSTSAWLDAVRRIGALIAVVALLSVPALVFIHWHGGVRDAVDQMITYGVREAEPLQLFVSDPPPAPRNTIHVRWAPQVDEGMRHTIARQFGLRDEARLGDPQDRTWSYVIDDASRDRLRALVTDPRVEDTHLIDRERFRLTAEPISISLRRALPFLRWHVRPDLYDSTAAGWLFVLIWLVTLAAAIALLVARTEPATPHVGSLVAMCVLLDLLIMRPPVAARIGGMAGPVVVLAAWLARRVFTPSPAGARNVVRTFTRLGVQAGVVIALAAAVWNLALVAEWRGLRVNPPTVRRLTANLAAFAASPPDVDFVSPRLKGMVTYVRECTLPGDRVYASWFVPELYFLTQRPFAARIVATFSGHWSDQRFQERSVAALASQSVPIVLLEMKSYDRFIASYPLMAAYLQQHYRVAGDTTFGDAAGGPYRVLVRRDRAVTRIETTWSLPCVA